MTSTSDGGGSGDVSSFVPNHLASLVPSFDPAKDDLVAYTQKVQLLVGMWPDQKWTELATRLILNCSGSAFLKLQLQQAELTKNEKKSIQRLIEVLGGHWGQINLEKQYEYAERALYRCNQKNDETADSFLARADIMWTELISRNISLKDIQPYVTLRGSLLSAEDKKRVLLDADIAGSGKLSAEKVGSAIRLLGASFFQDMTGNKKVKGKTYDQATLIAEGSDLDESHPTLMMETADDQLSEGDLVETFLTEGDEDAAMVADFENAAVDCVQNNEDLAAALNAYTDARRRLGEKARHRGFWPVQGKSFNKGRGKFSSSKGVKGKFQGKGSRKTLQQRILESRCRICDRVGHWKAECPQNPMRQSPQEGSQAGRPVAPTSYVHAASASSGVIDQLPLEFLDLPSQEVPMDEPRFEFVLGSVSFHSDPFGKLRETLQLMGNDRTVPFTPHQFCSPRNDAAQKCHFDTPSQTPSIPMSETCFATHGSFGVLDLGATKTVIGSSLVKDLMNNLQPHVREKLSRCPCKIAFRFGNHGILESEQALVVPIFGYKLKIAIVPGSTPFLMSNTLLRTLGAVIDTQAQSLYLKKCGKTIPLQLTPKGLFLIDLNDLVPAKGTIQSEMADTHHVTEGKTVQSFGNHSSIQSGGVDSQKHLATDNPTSIENHPSLSASAQETQAVSPTFVGSDQVDMSPAISEGSKKFARSFIFPFKTRHVAIPTAPTSSGEDRGATSRAGTALSSGDGATHHRLRQHPQGKDVSSNVGSGTTMGVMVRVPLPELGEEEPSPIPELCHLHGGSSRGDGTKSPSDPIRERPECPHWQGIWQEIPGSKGQGQSHDHQPGDPRRGHERHVQFDESGSDRPRRDPRSRVFRDGQQRAVESCNWPLGKPHAEPGECLEPRDPPPGSYEHAAADFPGGSVDFDGWEEAGDLSADCLLIKDSEDHINQERHRFKALVETITAELDQCLQQNSLCHNRTPSLNILEVFCNSDSQITHQCQQLGFRASRFDLSRGDLHTPDGRRMLFQELVHRQPRNLWFAPTCGPWSNWSNLNGNKSLAAWDQLHSSRLEHLSQIALGLVLLRYQRSKNCHFHWEQPRSSLMFKLPYLSEIHYYMVMADFEMCTAGNLCDPISGKAIKKSMSVLTTSMALRNLLSTYRCPGNHEHQVLEGSININGYRVNRTQFSEKYPRKFARLVVRQMCKIQWPREKPYRLLDTSNMPAETFAADSGREPKRPRISSLARLKTHRTIEVESLPGNKRQRLLDKTTPKSHSDQWKEVISQIQSITPRVGKITFSDSQVIQQVQELISDKEVRMIVACRGASRTLSPPTELCKGEAPFRRAFFIDRNSDKILTDAEWELWENLAQRQLVRPSRACWLNITVFACNPRNSPQEENREEKPLSDESHAAGSSPNPEGSQTSLGEVKSHELLPSQESDLKSSQQSSVFSSLPKDEQIALIRAHKNLGHPSPERLSSLLRQQGFRPEVARAALEFKCSVCDAHAQPKHSRPSAIRDDSDFNDRICVDGLKWTNSKGQNFHLYHIVDWSTNFHVAKIAPNRSSSEAIQVLGNSWFSWAGTPGAMLVDAGSEFNSQEFSEFAQAHNVKVTTISSEAHFQNGKSERHGAVLQTMLSKYEKDHPIASYQELEKALWWCTQAKNACSLKRGYAPEVLVLGKHTKLPGSVTGDELLPAHLLADAETAQGLRFREQLTCREHARKAFIEADNDASLRRAILRRSCPHRQQYTPGEWVMIWRQGKGALPGMWQGPMKIVVHENAHTVWTTMSCKLFRVAPEHVRPVTASEARDIKIHPQEPTISQIASQIPQLSHQGVTQVFQNAISEVTPQEPVVPAEPSPQDVSDVVGPQTANSTGSEGQPDVEPEVSSSNHEPEEVPAETDGLSGLDVPIPESESDELVCEEIGLYSEDIEKPVGPVSEGNHAWRCEVILTASDIEAWKSEPNPEELSFVVSAAKRQRSEVKLSELSPSERAEFSKAKSSEIQNWVKTGTISRILRDKISPDQILRCRWILTWKPIDEADKQGKSADHKAKARLVVLGYLDPQLEDLPRDSPTLGRHSKMLLLQLIASNGWDLKSFDVKAAFLQGKPQNDRVLGLEPVPEMRTELQMRTNEILKLEKGAYGLVDAPYLWFSAILEELQRLQFEQSPFDPCVFILRNPRTQLPDGIIGLHVDDGLCGGNERFDRILQELERKYPFGSKKLQSFTFTGIDMTQAPDKSIRLSQSKYVRNIEPIRISRERRAQLKEAVTESERQALRGLIGSLQYAAVHTRPDLSSRLSFLQSDVNRATVETLIMGNQALYEAKSHHDVNINIQSIPISDLRFLAFSDASFASKNNPNSHTGSIIMATHRDISKNISCPVSPLSWGCKKIQRVVTSTLAAETVSLSSVLDQLSWIRLCWSWMLDNRVQWQNPDQALKKLPEAFSSVTVHAQNLSGDVAATDCKSLYDLVTRTAPPQCTEFRTQLAARAIKDLLTEGTSLRWVHSGAQLADCLTKVMETSFLRETLIQGRYKLHDELAVLKNRASTRNRIKWLKENSQSSNDECFLTFGFLGV